MTKIHWLREVRRAQEQTLSAFAKGKITFPQAVQRLARVGFEVEVACSIVINSMMREEAP